MNFKAKLRRQLTVNSKKRVLSVMLVVMLMAIGLFLSACGGGTDQQGEQNE